MQVQQFPSIQLIRYDKLIQDFIRKSTDLKSYVREFATLESLSKYASQRTFPTHQRTLLKDVLMTQYEDIECSETVRDNIQKLTKTNTFTVTTGHQLCLFTGPLYSVFKVASTIKLAQQIQDVNPNLNIVPVFWLASEDHDAEEINHAYFFGKKLTWQVPSSGAVGRFPTNNIDAVLDMLNELSGHNWKASDVMSLLKLAYSKPNLSSATRFLFNELFGQYGLVILDADHPDLKREFLEEMQLELLDETAFHAINSTNERLKSHGYNTQINPRKVNLFYLDDGLRNRIEADREHWSVLDTHVKWSRDEILSMVKEHPEKFSPNVATRPIYQEKTLPNLAYIGGPGEIAYWLQLKDAFGAHKVDFPLLILRDSALLLSDKMSSNMKKLGLDVENLFQDYHAVEKQLIQAGDFSLSEEWSAIEHIMKGLETKVSQIDPTLLAAVSAETKKMNQGLDQIGKKVVKAMKQKEEVKLNQWSKLHAEVFPDGVLQERHDNFFQYRNAFGEDLIHIIIREFEPLKNQLTVISNQ